METSGNERAGRPFALIAVLAACVVSAQAGTSAVNVALPDLAAWTGGGFGDAQWAVVAYLLAMTAASLIVGYVGDVIGRGRALLIGLIVFVVAGVACAMAPTMWALVLARAVQGVGAAGMAALPLALARDAVGPERSGSIMGLLGTAAAVGTGAGPAIGGLLLGAWGWPAIFWAMLPIPLLTALAAPRVLARVSGPRGGTATAGTLRGRAGGPRQRGIFDLRGSAIVAVAATLYAVAFTGTVSGTRGALALMAAAGVLIVVLVPIERRAAHPVLPLQLLRTRPLGLGAALNLVVGAVMMSTLVVGPFYLSGALGLSPTAVGLAMAAGPIASIVSGVLAGRLVDRGVPTRLMTAGLLVMTAAAVALALLPPLAGLPGYLAGTVLLAPGYQLFMAANNTEAMSAVARERRGTAAGVLGLSRNLGLVTGSSVLGTLFATAAGATGQAAATADALDSGLRLVFGIAAACLAAACLASFAGKRR